MPRHWSEGPKTWYPWALICGRGMLIHPKPSFEEWAETATSAQILELLTERFIYGEPPACPGNSVNSEELSHFDQTVSSLSGISVPPKPDTEVAISKAMAHLIDGKPGLTSLIAAAEKTLARLLVTHAAFPFITQDSSTLTWSSLLRAVVLLTSNSDHRFNGPIAPRTQSRRIDFIFASLVSSLPRRGSTQDILDIVCRVPYPREFHRILERYNGRAQADLVPVAERLSEELKDTPVWQTHDRYLHMSDIRPLADLVAALTDLPVSDRLNGKERLDSEEFEAWATDAKLMRALDKLFCLFLESREQRDKIEAWQKSHGIVYENRKAKEPLQSETKGQKADTVNTAMASF